MLAVVAVISGCGEGGEVGAPVRVQPAGEPAATGRATETSTEASDPGRGRAHAGLKGEAVGERARGDRIRLEAGGEVQSGERPDRHDRDRLRAAERDPATGRGSADGGAEADSTADPVVVDPDSSTQSHEHDEPGGGGSPPRGDPAA